MLYLICKCSSSQILQTQLVAQSHEERTELELSRHQVPVLCVVPCECNLKDHLHIIQTLDSQSHTEDMFFLGGWILISFFLMFVRGNAEKRAEVKWPASLQTVFMLYKIINKGCTIPINGISGYHHVICRLAQVKEKLQLISQYQLIPL